MVRSQRALTTEREDRSSTPPGTVGGRYVLEQAIGEGGMARVYRALDTSSGRHVALKRLRQRRGGESLERSRELFQREFHTLVQLAHPRIVAAIDYGQDGALPYYTMELLDGGDLRERSPLPWPQACAVARDLCSALSLLHSRRQVYRDLSPRNVRCTSDGTAKLIDFGALAPMGSGRNVVCTPAMASPELVYRQPVDGRSDLYALGATLYCTLVGHAPYPARSFQQLPELWKRPPARPSELVRDIPPALDALVMELLQLEPQLRPSSAAEVSQRLCAIAGLPADEQLQFSQAYLTTPTLIGREAELSIAEGAFERLRKSSTGGALLIRGPAGVGRSRLLDACALAAKLAGLSVVQATADAVGAEPYATARAIVRQLFELLPEEALHNATTHVAVLCTLWPPLREKLDDPPAALGAAELDRNAGAALRGFVLDVARQKPLLLAVDDVERIDAESAALLALLAYLAPRSPLLVIASSAGTEGAEVDALRLLDDACRKLVLGTLDQPQAQALLASMFGDVPNLAVLVRRLHELAAGNPQHLLRLCQHLLDRGVIRYRAGAWVLPDRFDVADLPATMSQSFEATVQALEPDARALGRAFAACPDERFTFDECLALGAQPDGVRVFRALDRLLSANVVCARGADYALTAKVWVGALRGEQEDPELQVRLARVFSQRGDGLRAARHLFRVGRNAEGLDALVSYAEESRRQTMASSDAYLNMLAGMPRDWLQIFATGLALCQELGRSPRDVYLIEIRLSSIITQHDVGSEGHLAALAQRLAVCAGLDLFAQLDPALPPAERLQRALAAAAERYRQTPEQERVLDPKAAIGQLARTLIVAVGSCSRTLELEEWRRFPSLAPFAALSPSVALMHQLALGFDARIAGRFEAAAEIYRAILAQLEATSGAGLDPPFVESLQSGLPATMGMFEAVLGVPAAEQSARAVEGTSLYHGSALAIRMIEKVWQGDVASADRLVREHELWRLEQSRQQAGDVVTMLWTLPAHAGSDDLTRTRHTLEAIERTASRIRSWQPIASWARGEYERVRGDHAAALEALDAALAQMPEGEHQIWPLAMAARLKVLTELGRHEHARAEGERALQVAQAHGLGFVTNFLRLPLALACAKLGDASAAFAQIEAALAAWRQLGATGLVIGFTYEAAAHVAAIVDHAALYDRYLRLCRESFFAHPNPALAAKFQRLAQARRRARADSAPSGEDVDVNSADRLYLESLLRTCSDRKERLERTLSLLVAATSAHCGVLYSVHDGRLDACVQTEDCGLPPDVVALADKHLQFALGAGVEEATADAESTHTGAWTSSAGHAYRPVLLSHHDESRFMITGLCVLRCEQPLMSPEAARTAAQLSRLAAEHGDLAAHVVRG